MTLRLLTILFVVFLSACSAKGPLYKDFMAGWHKQELSKARVVVFMPKLNGVATDAYFGIDGKRLGLVKAHGFNAVDIDPGTVSLEIDDPGTIFPPCKLNVVLTANSLNFFEVRWADASDGSTNLLGRLIPLLAHSTDGEGKCSGGFRLVQVDSESAELSLRSIRLSN